MPTPLPSFIELMASLGLDAVQPTKSCMKPSSCSPCSTPARSPRLSPTRGHSARSKSITSARELTALRNRAARYAPYSPPHSTVNSRRGSISSVTSSSSQESETRAPLRVRRNAAGRLTVNVYDSTPDLSATAPISTYVRRKTPGASPTSPAFARREPSVSPVTLTIPKLPPLFISSHNLSSESSYPSSPEDSASTPEEETSKLAWCKRQHSGLRISTLQHCDRCHHQYNSRIPAQTRSKIAPLVS
ncbi:hypothetical protein FISHEDRAFT_72844 [Fistulina hepatica ATCC 64428]|nr:hypothetical protein FISHEDRAFT_72844 [Fistulina hepatica ATCC 64428]